jgi:hypothetical protein
MNYAGTPGGTADPGPTTGPAGTGPVVLLMAKWGC